MVRRRRRRRWRRGRDDRHVPAPRPDLPVTDVRWLAHVPAGEQRQQWDERQWRRQQRPGGSGAPVSRCCRRRRSGSGRSLPQLERPQLHQHPAPAGALQSLQLGAILAAGRRSSRLAMGAAHLLPGAQSVPGARAQRIHLLRTPGEIYHEIR